jgi:uncharacterized protein
MFPRKSLLALCGGLVLISCVAEKNAASGAEESPAKPLEGKPLELRRRVFLGTQIGPVSDEARRMNNLATSRGIEILKVFPNSSASAGGLKEGDVLVSLGEAEVAGTPDFLRRLATHKGGDEVELTLHRDGAKRVQKLKFIEMACETSDTHDVVLGAVDSAGGRLRTIVTRPRRDEKKPVEKRPALMILQGLGPFSMERLPGTDPGGYHAIIDDFTRRGYVTLRVDKPGCGDSLGGPLADVDFETQLDGFRQGLKWLKEQPDVDATRILIFGHSMGGVWGPLLAAETPVRGIAVFGTLSRTWAEYDLSNSRRQLRLARISADEVDRRLKQKAMGIAYVYGEKLTPDEAAQKNTEVAEWVENTFQSGVYFSGCHYKFFQQLSDRNLGAAWQSYPGKVLSLWGVADFIADSVDHSLIAEIVNQNHPGHAEFVAMPGIDHGFNAAESQPESHQRWGQPGGKFNPAIVETLRAWSDRING